MAFRGSLAEQWDVDDVVALLAPEAGVPLADWRDLAQTFLKRIDGSQSPSR